MVVEVKKKVWLTAHILFVVNKENGEKINGEFIEFIVGKLDVSVL